MFEAFEDWAYTFAQILNFQANLEPIRVGLGKFQCDFQNGFITLGWVLPQNNIINLDSIVQLYLFIYCVSNSLNVQCVD